MMRLYSRKYISIEETSFLVFGNGSALFRFDGSLFLDDSFVKKFESIEI